MIVTPHNYNRGIFFISGRKIIFEKELQHFEELHPDLIQVVAKRSDELVNAYIRFEKYIGAKRFEAVTPVLPPDILGVYCINS